MTCTCSGHANEPNLCPACRADLSVAEEVAEEVRLGKLDHDLGEYALEQEGVEGVLDVLRTIEPGEVQLRDGNLEWDTIASIYGWKRPPEFMPVPTASIGEAYRKVQDPLVTAFVQFEIDRRLEPSVPCPRETSHAS